MDQVDIELKNSWILKVRKFSDDKFGVGLSKNNKFTERLFINRNELIKLILALELVVEEEESKSEW